MKDYIPLLGITMGDPSGVGPEIIAKALSNSEIYNLCRPLIIGDAGVIRKAVEIVRSDLKINAVETVHEAIFKPGIIDVFDQRTVDIDKLEYGKVSVMGGRAAFMAIKKAIELALDSSIDGTVTAPINKEALNLSGNHYSGHTEIYADLTGTKDYAMMLAHKDFRVIHVSTHVSLREACDLVKKERVFNVIKLADKNLKCLGLKSPRIAVAGLNPHAGENGMFGTEEVEEIIPAINTAKESGINASGPFPPDTIFSMAEGGLYDIVVVMYHDQGHIPLKLSGFKYDKERKRWKDISGVNITLGLPIIRTSVDHGTAFDQAGKGTASKLSLVNAIEYAVKLGGYNK